ncbi:uncharacterized protein LOC133205984 [Saccostrea echinata]|uniref:uncharacterized protein LOC133205984 n=1 Tax=Saccostrea echinata TaxID=191078 RepID=UPI002A837D1D|nr:uncharacterized protein LOC133205984 [Saccostrea echinata]
MGDADIYENVQQDKSDSDVTERGYILMTDKKCIKCQLKGNPNIKCKCQVQQAKQGNNTDKLPQSEDYENMKVTRIKNMEKIETLRKQTLQKEANMSDKAEQRLYDNPMEENARNCECCSVS